MESGGERREIAKDSLRKRYAYKLFTNGAGLVVSLAIQALIPRGLGPRAYGDYSYLTNFFTQVVGFFDTGTSLAFYTKLSQRPREHAMVAFYFCFGTFVFATLLLITTLLSSSPLSILVWPNQKNKFIYLAFGLGILLWFVQILGNMADAYSITVKAELIKVVQKVIGLLLIVSLFSMGLLNLENYFLVQYALALFLGIALLRLMRRQGVLGTLSPVKLASYVKEFYHYCHPLFIYSLVALLAGLFDRWLLQRYGGSIQQGFYGLSFQIGAVCFVFTSAITPLIMREFTIAFAKQDLLQMAHLFRRYIPLLYGIAAFFSCFIAVEASNVAYIFGGAKFHYAALAITIMAFYPIHQTYGQLSGSVFYATAQTRLYRNIGIVFMIIGLPITYFLIAPKDMMGLNAGSTGLAVKMVLVQFFGVNVQLYFNLKLFKLPFWKYFAHQIFCVASLLLVAYVSVGSIDYLQSSTNIVINFILSGALYSLLVAGFTLLVPALFGLTRNDVQTFVLYISKKLTRRVLYAEH